MKARMAVAAMFLGLLGIASSSSAANESPKVDVRLVQTAMSNDTFYFRGPINIQYQMTVTNPTNEEMKLERIDLSSIGPGAYTLRTGATPISKTIAPNGTTTLTLSAWGRASGGYLRSAEPVTIRGIAYFSSPGQRSFVKQFTQSFMP